MENDRDSGMMEPQVRMQCKRFAPSPKFPLSLPPSPTSPHISSSSIRPSPSLLPSSHSLSFSNFPLRFSQGKKFQLFLIFLIYPACTSLVMRSFVCKKYRDGNGKQSLWMVDDASIQCTLEGENPPYAPIVA